jgi:hypothetical protein
MITGRIWAVTRKAASMCLHDSRESRRGYLHTTARIVLESGLLYAVSIAVQLGAGALKSNVVYPIADCVGSLSPRTCNGTDVACLQFA